MALYLVTCREMSSSDERIVAISCVLADTGARHRFTEEEAIKRIEDNKDTFHVKDARGNVATVHVEAREGRKFLITIRDGVKTDNLLALPKCSLAPRPVTPTGSHCVLSTPWRP